MTAANRSCTHHPLCQHVHQLTPGQSYLSPAPCAGAACSRFSTGKTTKSLHDSPTLHLHGCRESKLFHIYDHTWLCQQDLQGKSNGYLSYPSSSTSLFFALLGLRELINPAMFRCNGIGMYDKLCGREAPETQMAGTAQPPRPQCISGSQLGPPPHQGLSAAQPEACLTPCVVGQAGSVCREMQGCLTSECVPGVHPPCFVITSTVMYNEEEHRLPRQGPCSIYSDVSPLALYNLQISDLFLSSAACIYFSAPAHCASSQDSSDDFATNQASRCSHEIASYCVSQVLDPLLTSDTNSGLQIIKLH